MELSFRVFACSNTIVDGGMVVTSEIIIEECIGMDGKGDEEFAVCDMGYVLASISRNISVAELLSHCGCMPCTHTMKVVLCGSIFVV